MNTEILKRLTVAQLQELEKAIAKEMTTRMDYTVFPGRTGYFIDGSGNKQFVRVDRVNPKSVSVKPIDGGRGGWRLPASMLVMDGVPISQEKRHRSPSTSPAETYNVETW